MTDIHTTSSLNAVAGVPRQVLRLEALAAFAGALWCYQASGGNWIWFVVLFLVPDLSMLAYRAGPRIGAIAYNLVHTYAVPAALGGLGVLVQNSLMIDMALIWVAHIGLDRVLGYGLKYETGFSDTHFGRIGKRRA